MNTRPECLDPGLASVVAVGGARGEREWLLVIWEREREWKISFPTFGNGNGKIPFPIFGNGSILSVKSPQNPNFWTPFSFHSRHDNPFPLTGTGMENCIPKFWERERESKKHSQLLGTGTGIKNSFPNFGNGNRRLVFPKMVGNGNSRSPLGGAAPTAMV